MSKYGTTLPDYRGYFLRGLGGNSAGLGIEQEDAIRRIWAQWKSVIQKRGEYIPKGAVTAKEAGAGDEGDYGQEDYLLTFDSSLVVPTANENRPINKAVRYIVKVR